MSNPRSFQTAISTSMPPISSASRSWRVRRAPCSGRAPQAGVVRYITNKPKLDVTEAMVNAGYATTAHGDHSSNVDATINIPLIADTLAVRGVIYNETAVDTSITSPRPLHVPLRISAFSTLLARFLPTAS